MQGNQGGRNKMTRTGYWAEIVPEFPAAYILCTGGFCFVLFLATSRV